jgi:hypothetical protein
MKNLFSLGVRNSLFLFVIFPMFFVACGKGDNGSGPLPGPTPTPTPTVKATLTVTGAPAGIVWYANNTVTYTISSTNATSVFVSVDGSTPELVGPSLTLNNLTANTTLVFTTGVATGFTAANPETRTINVVKPRLTIFVKDVPAGWINSARRDSAYGSGSWFTSTSPGYLLCPRWKFDIDNSCMFMNIESNCGLPGNSPNYNVLNADETTLTVGQRTYVIVSLTNTKLVIRDYSNSTGVCTEREFIK